MEPTLNPDMGMTYGSEIQHEETDRDSHKRHMHDMCARYHYHMVRMETTDGHVYDGIISEFDNDHVYLLVPVGDMDDGHMPQHHMPHHHMPYHGHMRQFEPFGGVFPHDFRVPRRFRRFRPFRFPFFFLRRLFFPIFF